MTFQWKSDAIFSIINDQKRIKKQHAMNQNNRKLSKNSEKIVRNHDAWNQSSERRCKKAKWNNWKIVDWLIDSFIRRCGIGYVGPMRVYLLVFTYRKTLQGKKNPYLLSLIGCFSGLFRSPFGIDLMSFFICCSLIPWYVLLLIADWMKMFMS